MYISITGIGVQSTFRIVETDHPKVTSMGSFTYYTSEQPHSESWAFLIIPGQTCGHGRFGNIAPPRGSVGCLVGGSGALKVAEMLAWHGLKGSESPRQSMSQCRLDGGGVWRTRWTRPQCCGF